MTRKKKNEVAKSPQNSSEWHALLEREGLLLLWELIFVISALDQNVTEQFFTKVLHKHFQI